MSSRSLPERPNLEHLKKQAKSALWGARCAVKHPPLAEALLDGGANPTDGVSTHTAGGTGDVAALELLHRLAST